MKSHIGPTGPGKCTAGPGKCPFGGEDIHFNNIVDARAAFEKTMDGSTLTKVSKLDPEENFSKIVDLKIQVNTGSEEIKEIDRKLAVISRASENRGLIESDEFSDAQKNMWANGMIKSIRATEPYVMNRMDPHFPDREYPDMKTLTGKWDSIRDELNTKLYEKLSEVEKAEDALTEARNVSLKTTGFEENPKYGIPSGETTASKKFTRQNYSTLPTRDVPILKDAKQFCSKCGGEAAHVPHQIAALSSFKHANPEDAKSCGSYTPIAGKCTYCGTSNSKYLSFKQQSWSDEHGCSRCGGVSGYAIGD